MLTLKEKQEFVRDGRDIHRREQFRRAAALTAQPPLSVEAYTKFLSQVHEIFSNVNPVRFKSKTKLHKL